MTGPEDATPLRRRFITVEGRRVHCLRMGQGSPVVLVHSSPTNAWYVLPHMQLLAERHTCFAFDTPGFGLSQPLPGDELAVADLAAALAANMAAVGLPACPVFGTHTGAAIALSLAANHPERVTALVLDAVPIFGAEERAELMDGYFEALDIDDRGGHYARTWTRFRDQYVWFPWTRKTPDRLNETDLGSPAGLQAWMMSFFYAGRTYKAAYRSAWTYGEQALADVCALQCPALFTAAETDMLHPHLARLPALGPGQEIRPIGNDRALKDALIAEAFGRWPATVPAPEPPFELADGLGIRQQFVDLPGGGQVLLRHAGRLDAPAVLLLHDAPGSGFMHEELIAALAYELLVIAPDLPGCGGSDPLATERQPAPSLADFADAVAQACAQAGIARACVYGIGLGASLALVLAERHPQLAASLILCSPPLPDDTQRAALQAHDAPPITLQADGSHWYRTWLMLRDRRVWFPWFEPRAAQLRRVSTDLDGVALHDATFELMKQHASYHHLIDAVWAHDTAAALAALRQPLRLCHDPQVPTFAHDERLRALCPGVESLPCDGTEHMREVVGFVAATVPARG